MRQTRLSHGSKRQDEAMAPRAPSKADAPPYGDVMSLQQSIGNAAVGQMLGARQRASGEVATPVDLRTQGLIAAQMGRGQAIDASLQGEMAGVVDGPVGGVRIHRGPESDALTRLMSATAFTQDRDVFLRSDRDPASAAGRATLAHELTHVAQGSVGPGAVMREPAMDEAVPMDSGQRPARIPSVVARIVFERSGPLRGNSKVPGHDGEVEIDSFQFGSTGPNSKSDKNPANITISKPVDEATTQLMKALASGERILTAQFVFIKRKDDGTVEDGLILEFVNGFVTSYSTGGSGDAPSESVSFQFDPK